MWMRYQKQLEQNHLQKQIKRMHKDITVAKFFDFYTLNLLDYFAGEKTLNHSSRAERITNKYVEVTEEMYAKIRRALTYSIIREFRHFGSETFEPVVCDEADEKLFYKYDMLKEMSIKYDLEFIRNRFDRYLKGELELHDLHIRFDIDLLIYAFSNVDWALKYGGRNWAKAAQLLREEPKTVHHKQLWIDRVLDLQHNTGHILNKTDFWSLSQPKQCHRQFEPRKNKRSPLNYRRYANSISDLIRYSSSSVRKLAIANMNYIPPQIR
jgi:hypothetical protein